MARYRAWGEEKVFRLMSMLRVFVRVPAGMPEIVEAYSRLYVEARRAGRYSQTAQNDLWIAATAHAARATIYTVNWKHFEWIDPTYLSVAPITECT